MVSFQNIIGEINPFADNSGGTHFLASYIGCQCHIISGTVSS